MSIQRRGWTAFRGRHELDLPIARKDFGAAAESTRRKSISHAFAPCPTWRNLLGSVKPLTETIGNFCYSGCIDHGVGALAQRLFQVSLLAIMNCNVNPG